jgi:subtilase family serine protease
MRTLKSLLPALVIASLLSSLSYAAAPDRISGALTGGQTVPLRGNVHHKALPQYDQGPADPSLRLGYMTLLTVPSPSQQKALNQLLAEQQDRNSPNYHKWLTAEQWADRFGLSHGDVQKLTEWLKSQGFTVQSVAHGRNWITFGGTAAQVQNAFGIEMHRYKVDGEMHVANATPPRIPAALSGIVTGVRGLDDFYLKPHVVKNVRAALAARPNYYDPIFPLPSPQNFLAPGDIATMYDINALYKATPTAIDGTGEKLVIAGQTDIYLADVNYFRGAFGLSQITGCSSNSSTGVVIAPCNATNFQYVLLLPTGFSDPLTPSLGDLTEADLDIEWSGAVARNAQIIYVNAPAFYSGSTYLGGGVWNAWYYAVDNQGTLGETVISLSYGNCEFNDNNVLTSTGQPGPDEVELMKANSEGITFLNSSGDSGAAECDSSTNTSTSPANLAVGGIAVSYPASSPEVTGVGGTALTFPAGLLSPYWGTTNGGDGGSAQNAPLPETAWNDDEELATAYGGTAASIQSSYAIVSTGGGPSNCAQQTSDNSNCVSGFGRPGWQNVTISGQASTRFSPDVSLAGSPNFPGYIFCTPQSAWISGSTNSASTCASGIPAALSLTDSSNNPAPSLVGGTSASTPAMAGIVILLNQYLGAHGLGNINPTLYGLAATPSLGVFHPVTTGNNNVYCEVGQPVAPWPTALQCPSAGVFGYSATAFDATTSYNVVTGLGSVDANNLVLKWNSAPASPDFTLAPILSTLQVTQGGTVNATINVQLASGFTGMITFSCPDPPTSGTCTAPPNTNVSGQVSFAIQTAAPTAELQRPSLRGTRIFYAALLPGLFGIMFAPGSRKRSLRGMRLLGLIVVLGCSTLWLASCGGSSSSGNPGNQGTPKGTYTVSVTGTSGTSTATTSFTIVVQ